MPGAPSSSLGGGFPLGLAGAIAATRYVGATASGAPASGTFAVGDYIIDQTGKVYVCTVAGSPGTWTQAGGGSSADLFYAEVTSGVSITSSAEATPTQVVTLGAQTYAAVPTWFEFFQPGVQNAANTAVVFTFRDGTTELCRFGDYRVTSSTGEPGTLKLKLTPTAASHTYNVAAFRDAANVTVNAGTGSGGASTYAPIYLRAYLA